MIMWFVFLQNMRRIDLSSSCSNSITASFRGQRSSGPQTELDLRGENNNSDSKSCSGSAVFHHQMKVVSSGADSAFRGGKNDSAVSRSILLDLKMLQHRRWPTDPLTHQTADLLTCRPADPPNCQPTDPPTQLRTIRSGSVVWSRWLDPMARSWLDPLDRLVLLLVVFTQAAASQSGPCRSACDQKILWYDI